VITLKRKDEALKNEVVEENNPTDSPIVEEKAPEEVEVKELEPTPTEEVTEGEETTETEEKVQKKDYSHRVRELVDKAKAAEERVKSLEERIAELTGQVGQPAEFQPYSPQVTPGQEVSPEQYQADVMRTADSIVNLRIKQSEAVNRINTETSEVMRTYPELDPESDSFDRELSDTVTEAVEAHIRANPYSASVKKFVAKLMKPYKGAVTKAVGEASEQLAKQVSGAALKPTAVRKAEKSAEEKSIAELEQELGVVVS